MLKTFRSLARFFVIVGLLATLLSGCASTYTAPGPDFSLRGEAAKHEIENFTMATPYFFHSPHVYQMGPEGSSYWAASLEPVVQQVSPEAAKMLEHAKWWDYADLGFLVAAVGVAVAHNHSWPAAQTAYLSLLGLGIASGVYANITVGNALEEYNRALPRKFVPQAGVAISY